MAINKQDPSDGLPSFRPMKRSLSVALLFILWTIPGLLCALQVYTGSVMNDRTYAWSAILWYALPVWWVWIPITPLILWLGQRFCIERGRRLRGLLVHIPVSFILALLHLAFYAYWINVAAPYNARPAPVLHRTLGLMNNVWLHVDLLAYWAILGGYFALDYYHKFRERELRASRLEARLAESQLQALKMQLHPHFLFNTLNAISTLVLKKDTERAIRMLTRLSDFLRTTLDETNQQEIPLEQELAFTEQYLAIEQCRFQDRLDVVWEIKPYTRMAYVPSLILQPLVENAIRYGIAPQEKGGCLVLRATSVESKLRLQVQDNGPGLAEGDPGNGIGLSNTRTRLKQLYGEDHHLTLDNLPEGGLCVTIDLPFRTAHSTPAVEALA